MSRPVEPCPAGSRTFRNHRWIAWTAGIIGGSLLLVQAITGEVDGFCLAAAVLVALPVTALRARCRVSLGPDGLTAVNPLRSYFVAWSDLRDVVIHERLKNQAMASLKVPGGQILPVVPAGRRARD